MFVGVFWAKWAFGPQFDSQASPFVFFFLSFSFFVLFFSRKSWSKVLFLEFFGPEFARRQRVSQVALIDQLAC